MPQLVVTAVLVEGRSKSEVAREYGVSRRWVITLVQRYLAEGEAGLQPRSRRPGSSPRRTGDDIEDEIVRIRKELDRGGHEAGAATIAFHLEGRRAPRAATSGSRPPSPTNAGSSTSPTGRWPTAPRWRSSTSSTTTPGSASAATP
ncbi:MAG: helix-turn-helix domain-containing protein [Mycobacteriales bacterium]